MTDKCVCVCVCLRESERVSERVTEAVKNEIEKYAMVKKFCNISWSTWRLLAIFL